MLILQKIVLVKQKLISGLLYPFFCTTSCIDSAEIDCDFFICVVEPDFVNGVAGLCTWRSRTVYMAQPDCVHMTQPDYAHSTARLCAWHSQNIAQPDSVHGTARLFNIANPNIEHGAASR